MKNGMGKIPRRILRTDVSAETKWNQPQPLHLQMSSGASSLLFHHYFFMLLQTLFSSFLFSSVVSCNLANSHASSQLSVSQFSQNAFYFVLGYMLSPLFLFYSLPSEAKVIIFNVAEFSAAIALSTRSTNRRKQALASNSLYCPTFVKKRICSCPKYCSVER